MSTPKSQPPARSVAVARRSDRRVVSDSEFVGGRDVSAALPLLKGSKIKIFSVVALLTDNGKRLRFLPFLPSAFSGRFTS